MWYNAVVMEGTGLDRDKGSRQIPESYQQFIKKKIILSCNKLQRNCCHIETELIIMRQNQIICFDFRIKFRKQLQGLFKMTSLLIKDVKFSKRLANRLIVNLTKCNGIYVFLLECLGLSTQQMANWGFVCHLYYVISRKIHSG